MGEVGVSQVKRYGSQKSSASTQTRRPTKQAERQGRVREDVRAVVQAFRSGAADFLLKPCSEAELAKSLSRAMSRDAERRGLKCESSVLERLAAA